MGPTLSFRGIDNRSYYYLMDDQRFYNDFTGTGNALELRHLCAAHGHRQPALLGRGDAGRRLPLRSRDHARARRGAVRRARELSRRGGQDPVLASVKLIAEPWDTGLGGYQVGHFPPGWASGTTSIATPCASSGRATRASCRRSPRASPGSADIYNHRGRRPWASINFVTAHDGFTLRDLVSYNEKHNEEQEDNRDGSDNNNSWNCGVEGRPTIPRSWRCAGARCAIS